MNQEQPTVSYDEFMPQPLKQRLEVFNRISAENRALLIKTHVERWLADNRPRLAEEQIAVVEEMISYIAPDLYRAERDMEKIEREAEALWQKAEAIFSREDTMQIVSNRADYIPAVEAKNG